MIPFRYSTGNIVIASTPRDQIGDMFQQLSYEQLKILFPENIIHGTEGHYYIQIPASEFVTTDYSAYVAGLQPGQYHATQQE